MTVLKKLIPLCLLLCLIFSCTVPAFAYEQGSNPSSSFSYLIDDQAGYFTSQDMDSLTELMREVSEYCNVALVTTTDHRFSSTESFARNYLESAFNEDNGVVFVIDRCLNEIYLYSDGKAYRTITKSKAYSITDNTYIYATSSYDYDYYTCSFKTLEQILALFQGRRIAQPMKVICSLLLAIILGLFICYFIVMFTSKSKKASVKQILSGTYSKVYVNQPNKRFLSQSKKYSPQSSGGSGGGHRSGGGGGGGRSGGGGGHKI